MVELLRVGDKGLGLFYKGGLISSVNSAHDHADAWFVLEQVAENLAQVEGVTFKNCYFNEQELGENWQWSDVVKAHKQSIEKSIFEISTKHVKKDDLVFLEDVARAHPDWVEIVNLGYMVSRIGMKELKSKGSHALMFVMDYALMAGYDKALLSSTAALLADFDVY